MYLVSTCLLGVNCRYDGNNNCNEILLKLFNEGKVVPICPEVFGGLPTPRTPCEIIKTDTGSTRIIDKNSIDRTDAFLDGANKALQICKALDIKTAILKSRSPSCGYGTIYDGTFSSTLIDGNGFTADLLAKNGVTIYTENNFEGILSETKKTNKTPEPYPLAIKGAQHESH